LSGQTDVLDLMAGVWQSGADQLLYCSICKNKLQYIVFDTFEQNLKV